MAERTLRSKSGSGVKGVNGIVQENPVSSAEVGETDKEVEVESTGVETNTDGNSETGRLEMADCDPNNTTVILSKQFEEFMNTVRREFKDLKAEMKAENTKLAEGIKTASDEMTVKMEVANRNL
jgi:hypothetical protein